MRRLTSRVSDIDIPLYLRVLLLALFFVIFIGFFSYTVPTVHLNNSDAQALQNIYDEGNWKFQQSSTNIRVNEGGAVKLSIAGEAVEKVSGENNSIWIPIALLKELPEYFGIDGNNSSKAKLISYKVKGGLWNIVALIPGSSEKAQVKEAPTVDNISTGSSLGSQKQPQTRQVNLDVLMISPVFAQSLPLSLPVGQGLTSVQTFVELPTKAKFTSLSARGDSRSVKLTELPVSISEGKVKALARLEPDLTKAWDFSEIGYRLPGDKFSRQGLLNIAQWISLLCTVVIAVWIGWELWINRKFQSRQVDTLLKEIQNLISQLERGSTKQQFEKVSRLLEQIYESMSRQKGYFWRRFDRKKFDEDYIETIPELMSRLRDYSRGGREFEEINLSLQRMVSGLRYDSTRLESSKYKKRFWFYTVAAILAVIALVLLISSVTLSKQPNEKQNQFNDQSLLLSEFSLNVNSSDYNADKVKATLSFYALSTKPKTDNKGEITLEFGGNKFNLVAQNNDPDTVKVDAHPVEASSRQKYQIKNIPLKTVSDLGLLLAAAKGGIQIDQYAGIADIYNQAIKTEPKPAFINIEYEISGILTRKEQIPNRYFNWYPIDKSLLEMPIKIDGATAILSQIEVETPKLLYSQVKQLGIEQIDSDLKRDKKQANKYLLTPESNKFIVINAGSTVNVTGNYERNLPGKAFLTWGITIVGGCIGFLIGFFSSEWKHLWQGIGGSVVSGFIGFIALIANNRDFQSIISLRGQISFFDIFLLLSLISLVGTATLFYVSKNKKVKKIKWYMALTFAVVFSLIIPIVIIIFVHP